MDFPSRQTIHEVARVLNEWGITDFFKDTYNQNRNRFNIWCLELSKNTNLKVSNGCTKIVVKFGDDNWVIKIPYRTQINYCHREAENYALAHKAHLTNFFAPCYFYGVIDEIGRTPEELVKVEYRTPKKIKYDTNEEIRQARARGEAPWASQKEEALRDTKISYHFLKNFRDILSQYMK